LQMRVSCETKSQDASGAALERRNRRRILNHRLHNEIIANTIAVIVESNDNKYKSRQAVITTFKFLAKQKVRIYQSKIMKFQIKIFEYIEFLLLNLPNYCTRAKTHTNM